MRWVSLLVGLAALPAGADTVTALHTLRAQTVISAEDVLIAPGTVAGAASRVEDVIGLETRVAIYKGRPILLQQIGAAKIVERNQIVPLRFSAGALAISAEGRALDRGGAGDVIRVMNTTSRTTVSGVILADGTVSVQTAQSRRRRLKKLALIILLIVTSGCQRLENVGKAPAMTPLASGSEYSAMSAPGLPLDVAETAATDVASLWSGKRGSLLGDRRAGQRGDILTVVIEIDDKAEISNTSGRSRNGSDSMGIPDLLGIPQRLDRAMPAGASLAQAVTTKSASSYQGSGSVSRKEKLTLRVAATVVDALPNGVLHIQGSQEVRVNFELRELIVEGFVRPEDISRQNEITYDKIAGARISYGGRGQISDVQQPRYGQQVADIVLPF
jgi:flagellar L-ring protein precursor FlgH